MFRRIVGGLVDAAGRRPGIVLLLAALFMVGSWTYARKLELRSDFLELLPRDSPGFKAFEHQLGRVGGGATFLVVVESPDRTANEKFVDELAVALEDQAAKRKACVTACGPDGACVAQTCGPDFISYVEKGTKDLHKFFDERKWLYAKISDLEEADNTLDHEIAYRSGLVEKLGDDDDEATPKKPAPIRTSRSAWTSTTTAGRRPRTSSTTSPPGTSPMTRARSWSCASCRTRPARGATPATSSSPI